MTNLRVADKDITARQIKVKDLPQVGAAIAPFMNKFDHLAKDGGLTHQALIKLCMEHVDDFVRLCVVMTDADADWLRELPPNEFYKLVGQVVTVSHDFFLTELEPSLTALVDSINRQMMSMILSRLLIGLNQPFSDLLATDTPEMT